MQYDTVVYWKHPAVFWVNDTFVWHCKIHEMELTPQENVVFITTWVLFLLVRSVHLPPHDNLVTILISEVSEHSTIAKKSSKMLRPTVKRPNHYPLHLKVEPQVKALRMLLVTLHWTENCMWLQLSPVWLFKLNQEVCSVNGSECIQKAVGLFKCLLTVAGMVALLTTCMRLIYS